MEAKIAHLQMIQGVVNRMAGNSFLIKGWSVMLVAALFALGAANSNPLFVILAYFPSFSFWALDAYFLRQERLFTRLHDHVRALPPDSIDFSMDTSRFDKEVERQFDVGLSPTLKLFHGSVAGSIIVVMVILLIKTLIT